MNLKFDLESEKVFQVELGGQGACGVQIYRTKFMRCMTHEEVIGRKANENVEKIDDMVRRAKRDLLK